VVLAVPEDVLSGPASEGISLPDPAPSVSCAPSQQALAELEARLAAAQHPIVIVGGPGWCEDTRLAVERFALRFDLPVAAAFRRQDCFDNRHRSYVGHLGFGIERHLVAALRAADLVLAIGARLGEVSTGGYELIRPEADASRLVRIHPDWSAMAVGPAAGLSIVSGAAEAAESFARLEPVPNPPWRAWRHDLRSAFEATHRLPAQSEALDLDRVLARLSDLCPEDAIITNGAGNYAQALHRRFLFKRHGTSLATAYGCMGYSLPAAIAAKLARPEAPVVAVAGDGCFMMSACELATAVQYALPIVTIVADNGMYGTIRQHQERAYPGRVSATTLVNPDFASLARAHGAHGLAVSSEDQFDSALQACLAEPGPSLIHLRLGAGKI
jgi:acetolactate synthase-1/2/3 large subunit